MKEEFFDMLRLENYPSYGKKYYEIYKENQVISLVGQEGYRQIHDFWLEECEADIVGGHILLSILEENFGDKKFVEIIKQYVEDRIARSKLILYGPKRDEVLEAADSFMHAVPILSNNRCPLRAEYNEDGSRKNLFQLFQTRRELQADLEEQLNFYYFDLDEGRRRIDAVSKSNIELLNGFIYRAIEHCSDEEFAGMLANCTEEEIQIVTDSIGQRESEVREAMGFAAAYSGSETELKLSVEKHLLSVSDNCLRLRNVVTNSTTYFDSSSKK